LRPAGQPAPVGSGPTQLQHHRATRPENIGVTALPGRLRSATRAPLDAVAGFAASMVSILAGTLVVSRPSVALLPIAVLAAALLMIDPRARIAVVLFGGLFLLQTPGTRSRRTRFTARGQELSSSGNPRLAASFEFHPRYIRDVPG
jgi:hypothetical protein